MAKSGRVLVAILIFAAVVVVAPGDADAGWNRSFDSFTISVEEKVCADEMSFEVLYEMNTFELPDDFVRRVGAPYPRNDGLDEFDLFATENDAMNDVNPLLTVETPMFMTFVDSSDGTHEFRGALDTPLATPSDPDGRLWVRAWIDSLQDFVPFELEIGDPIYDCPPPAPVLDAEFLIGGPAVRVRSGLPGILYFDATNINVRSFKIMADNGKIAPVRHLVTVNDTAFVFFKPRRAGVKCSSDSFILTGMTSDGQPVSDVLPIVPFPCPFPG